MHILPLKDAAELPNFAVGPINPPVAVLMCTCSIPSMRKDLIAKMLEAQPGEPFLMFAMAKEFEKEGAWEDACSWYARLQREHPGYVGLYYHFGKVLERLGRPEDALAVYEAGIEVAKSQGDRHAWSELAAVKLALDES